MTPVRSVPGGGGSGQAQWSDVTREKHMYTWDAYEAVALERRIRLEEIERRRATLRYLGTRAPARERHPQRRRALDGA
ncbi:hypothetical protein [Paraoerskovia sediminicola]|nr:hypothetical protein [Paraoerskovia sediminicola]